MMTTIDLWLEQIENTDPGLQAETFARFTQLSSAEITTLVQLDRVKSAAMGRVFEYLGPTRLQHCIPGLLVYLQDLNWPAASFVRRVLLGMPRELLLPEIRRVFENHTDDCVWLAWLCVGLMEPMANDSDSLQQLKQPVLDFILSCPHWEEALMALPAILPVLSSDHFEACCQSLLSRFQATTLLTQEINELRQTFADQSH